MDIYNAVETGVSFLKKTLLTYQGASWMLYTAACALVLVMIFGRRKGRLVFLYPALILALTMLNPYIYPVLFKVQGGMEGDYYRVLWLVPAGALTAAGAVALIFRFKSGAVKLVLTAAVIAFLAITGEPELTKVLPAGLPENVYAADGTLVKICDYLDEHSPEDTPTVSFENEDYASSVRDYDASILLSDILHDGTAAKSSEAFQKAAAEDTADYYVVKKGSDLESVVKQAGETSIVTIDDQVIYEKIVNIS